MLKNYFKITLRNILRNKLFSSINVMGLSVSMASCLLLFVYVSDQLGYDQHHDGDVYRITSLLIQNNGTEFNVATASAPVAPAAQNEIPEVEIAIRLIPTDFTGSKDQITIGSESYYINDGVVADSNVFQVLNYDIITSNRDNLLPNGNSIVLEKEWAKKIFGNQMAVGQMLKLNTIFGEDQFEVTGVYDKNGFNTHFNPTYFISTTNNQWQGFLNNISNSWVGNNLALTYLKLREGAKVENIEEKIDIIFRRNGSEEMEAMGASKIMSLQPIEDIHTTTVYQGESANVISLTFIHILISIGVLILLLACVNYINLSTAQAGRRALEVGVRKVMGVSPRGLISQFLGESFFIVFVSLLFSILIAELTIPFFNNFVDHPIDLTSDNLVLVASYMLGFFLFASIIAGGYPALYLASFKVSSVLRGRNRDKGGVATLRKGLVIFQFVISIILISAILVISNQVDFIKNKELGFDSFSKMIVPLSSNSDKEKFQLLKAQFSNLNNVRKVSGAASIPGMNITHDMLLYKSGQTVDDALHIYNNEVDIDYVNALNIKLIAGRNFSENDYLDSIVTKILINRKAMADFGFDVNSVVGEELFFSIRDMNFRYQIVGVIDDINQFSLHKSVAPLMLQLKKNAFSYIIIDANLDNYADTRSQIASMFKEVLPATPFESFELNDHLTKQYESDFKTFKLIIYFALISIFISCMGLYALSMFVAERRFKEIGVRKALGAGVKDILILVSKDLSLLVLIAFIISIPISIYGVNLWLDSFAYKVTPQVSTFILAGVISVAIGWITIGYQSIRAARTNPVDVLKDE